MDLIEEAFDRAFNEPYCVPVNVGIGFVAFMDILGFSTVKKSTEGFRSSDETMAGVIFGMMDDALEEKNELIRFLDPRESMSDEEANKIDKDELLRIKNDQDLIRQNITLTFISDSFVCLADIKDKNTEDASFITSAFFSLVSDLATNMFRKGLPLRGGVDFGEFIPNAPLCSKPNAFLGEALMGAHNLEQRGCSASICLSESAELKCKELYRPWCREKSIHDWMNLCMADIAFKCKDAHGEGVCQKRPCVNLQQTHLYMGDYKGFVTRSFCEHGKDISNGEVQRKIDNTVIFLESRQKWDDVYNA